MPHKFDIIIVGAGPAGCVCAYQLRNSGLKVALIDKSHFPRDKVCGDAISLDVVNQLARIDIDLSNRFKEFKHKKAIDGLRFVAPNFKTVDIHLPDHDKVPLAFVSRRIDFDNFLFEQVTKYSTIQIFQNQCIQTVEQTASGFSLVTDNEEFICTMLVGGDGANSLIRRKLTDYAVDPNNHMAGIRQYYSGVKGLSDKIELHFYSESLPGYLWIFPAGDDLVNVGMGTVTNRIAKERINLKSLFQKLLNTHPNLKNRFLDAKSREPLQGFGLPTGHQSIQRSGDGFLLIGDAASLIDPFTGEGIGNAIRSGRWAADHLIHGFKLNRFDRSFNLQYDKLINSKMGPEFRVSKLAQRFIRQPRFFNYVVNRINNRPKLQALIDDTLTSNDMFSKLSKPSFYLKLLFG